MKNHRKEWPPGGPYPRRALAYNLDGRGRPVPLEAGQREEWDAAACWPEKWRLGRAEFGDVSVSCVFLGTDSDWYTSRPHLYELLMERQGQTYIWRYSSRRHALVAYRELVRRTRRVWEGPEPLGVRYGKRRLKRSCR